MKLILWFIALFLVIFSDPELNSRINYTDFFNEERIRFDFLLAGNREEVRVYPVQVRKEPVYAGSRNCLTDSSGMGSYRFRVYDELSGKLVFSKGFCTLFQEWQSTAKAQKNESAYYQALFFPCPRFKVRLCIDCRNRQGEFIQVFETEIDPTDYFIHSNYPQVQDTVSLFCNGRPETHVDLVFLSEGYSENEKEKFREDAERMCDALFYVQPFRDNRKKFNVTGLWTPSVDSGTDIPGERIYKDTRFNSSFYTFDIDRYLTTSDMKSVYDALAGIAWDYPVVLVNSDRYGGGGIYNMLSINTSGHPLTPKVMVHEFGHAFAGLGDEYYTSSVAYENFYNTLIEPWEPNLTTLVNFDGKWKSMVEDSIPIPTPRTEKFQSVVGVFEGGGYMAKEIYSPVQDCRMKSNIPDEFCPVCRAAIQKIIDLNCR